MGAITEQLRKETGFFRSVRAIYAEKFAPSEGLSLEQRKILEQQRWGKWPQFAAVLSMHYILPGRVEIEPKDAVNECFKILDASPQKSA